METCNLLSSEGYLVYSRETGQYRLTKDRDLLKKIRKLWIQCKDEYLFAQVCSKIEDIITFDKPLALSDVKPENITKDIGIPGLNIILNSYSTDSTTPNSQKVPGLPVGHCMLIKGKPGTGKTTMGLQIALSLKSYRSRFLTFEEDINQLYNDFKGYLRDEDDLSNPMGWNKSDIREITRSLTKIRIPSAWENPDIVLNQLISILDRELPRLIVIDSISRFRDLGGEEKSRLLLRKLIRNLKCRRITSFFTGEDRGDENAFEEYEVDGIIHLKWEGELLNLEVKKLRGIPAIKGPHSAAFISVEKLTQPSHRLISEKFIKNQLMHPSNHKKPNENHNCRIPYLTPGFNVFPDISVYRGFREGNTPSDDCISTGINGLDNLLKTGSEKGFRRGETILLVGSAGSGKTLLALQFMLKGYKSKKNGADENGSTKDSKNILWINFEGDKGTLRFAASGFQGSLKKDYDSMLEEGKISETGSRFVFIDFPPVNLDLNKIVFTLEAIFKNYDGIDRLVIDSITELEKARGSGQPIVKIFLAGLIQYLRDRGITTMFICRSDAFFKSIDKIEEQISSLVDLIICIRNFDVHNQIQKGIYVQKARGRYHDSKINRLIIDSIEGIKIEDSGWDIENLLAGDSSNIEKPRIFFKLFYENPAEDDINHLIIKDFDEERYPGDEPKFTLVRKPSIYTEFWSFRGQFSAGHANTRVLSIPDHILSAFRDNKRLAYLEKYIKSELLRIVSSEEHLKRLHSIKEDQKELFDFSNIDAIPCYRDYGVMVFNPIKDENGEPIKPATKKDKSSKVGTLEGLNDFFIKLKDMLEMEMKKDNSKQDDNKWVDLQYTWKNLFSQLPGIDLHHINNKDIRIPFAFPPLDDKSEFVAFFMELLWSFGGDIFEINIGNEFNKIGYEKKFKEKIRESVFNEFSRYCKNTEKKLDEEKFTKCFDLYGLKLKKIEIEDFKGWIVKEPESSGIKSYTDLKKESALKLNDEPFKKTIKLMLSLVNQNKAINPIHGDFRDRALIARKWYSRIAPPHIERCKQCIKPNMESCNDYSDLDQKKCVENYLSKLTEKKYTLFPLPLADIKLNEVEPENKGNVYYRSVTCLTYWSMVMLGNALSPEIGGNFIESMNAPEYYEKRLKQRAGMPVENWEVRKENFRRFDPNSYFIFDRILDNGLKNVSLIQKIGELNNEFKGKNEHSTEGNATGNRDNQYKQISKSLKELDSAFIRRDLFEILNTPEDRKAYFGERKKEINKRAFFHKVRLTRTAFYQVEEALHYQLRQLFIPGSSLWEKSTYDRYSTGKEKYNILEKTKGLTDEDTRWDDPLGKILDEFRLHVVFELLTYFYHEHKSGGGIEKPKSNEPPSEPPANPAK